MGIETFKQQCGYEIDKMWLPRVTSITSILNKPNLFRYFAESPNFMAAQERLDNAAAWGTMTHEVVGKMLGGKIVKPDAKIMPSIKAFQEWQGANTLKISNSKEDIEKRVVNKEHMFAGTIDLVAEVNGVRGVIDVKTSTGIWEEHYLQTAAYLSAFNEKAKAKEKCKTRWILRIDQYEECLGCRAKRREKEGMVRVTGGKRICNHQWSEKKGMVEFKELEGYEEDVQAFLAAKELWEWYNRKFLRRILNYKKS